jgi:hypothetical protein
MVVDRGISGEVLEVHREEGWVVTMEDMEEGGEITMEDLDQEWVAADLVDGEAVRLYSECPRLYQTDKQC